MNRNSRPLRLCAAIFTVLYLVAMFVPTLPEGAYSDARVLQLLDDSGSRAAIVLGGYALAAAAVAFLCFVAVMCSRLSAARSEALVSVSSLAGLGYAAMLMVASTSFSSLPIGRGIGEIPASTDPMLFRVMSNAGFHSVLVPGLLCAMVMTTAVSVLLRRNHAVPAWCANAGLVMAPLLLLGAAWVPQFLVPLWTLLVAFTFRPAPTDPGLERRERAEHREPVYGP